MSPCSGRCKMRNCASPKLMVLKTDANSRLPGQNSTLDELSGVSEMGDNENFKRTTATILDASLDEKEKE